jgi:hypothetical protein
MTIANLPHWVYEFIAADGTHVYVGCTSNLATRLASHKGKDWWAEVTRVEVDIYPDQRTGLDAERERIELYSPKYNSVFTDRYDAGGWGRRKAEMANRHAAGLLCRDRTCKACPLKAHALGMQCCRRWYGCEECPGLMPADFMDDTREQDCWRELERRHGGLYANRLCMSTWTALDALFADESGIAIEELERDHREALSRAVIRRRAS